VAVIAISQQLGSRGAELARMAAEKLGYRYLSGQDIVTETSRRYNVNPNQLMVLDERTPHFWERLRTDATLFLAFFRAVILKEMAKDKLVVASRTAAHHLPDCGCGLRVRVVGSPADRVRQVAQEEKLSPTAAEKRIRDYDREVRNRVQTLSAVDIDDPMLYGMVLNSSRLPLEVLTETLVAAAKTIDLQADVQAWARMRETAIAAEVRAALHFHPHLSNAQFEVRCSEGTVTVSGPGLVPPWDQLTGQVARQIEGVVSVQVIAEELPIRLQPG
jgi:cytidylate kinase